jgi:hypothetical protein
MAAIIDWHSKAVLSHRISNTMDSQLVMSMPVFHGIFYGYKTQYNHLHQ